MSRKRHQKGSLKVANGCWIAQWWEDGHRRNKTLGPIRKVTKSEAETELGDLVAPINRRGQSPSEKVSFRDFVNQVYLPWYRRHWKDSTAACNADRVKRNLVSEFEEWALGRFSRTELQDFLDRKAAGGFSYSTVAHLRWDLKQIFDLAVADDYLRKNPATKLFIPREAKLGVKRVMTLQEVKLLFSLLDVLPVRDRLVCKLALLAGMRPGEIFGLKWGNLKGDHLSIEQRLYRGKIDSPKTGQRDAAISEELMSDFSEWRALFGSPDSSSWVFPSETMKTPLAKDNSWRRWVEPKLKAIGLGWVNFQVMRRTHSSIMNDRHVNPKTVADQLGHSVDVNLNVYSQTAIEVRKRAVDDLEAAIRAV